MTHDEPPGVSFTTTFQSRGSRRGVLTIVLCGDWAAPWLPVKQQVLHALSSKIRQVGRDAVDSPVEMVTFDSTAVTRWDSRTLVAIVAATKQVNSNGIQVSLRGLPEGMQGPLVLAQAVPPRGPVPLLTSPPPLLARIGQSAMQVSQSLGQANLFFGQSLLSLGRVLQGRADFRWSDVLLFMQITGPMALPIVGVINLLLGMILAFMGAVQLQQFGAQIYVADLVALGQTREIAPMMTGIVMAGRTGAAYAAQLGTMQVNEEIDALKTFGFSPMDFLVLPRMLALAVMFPLLVLYADAVGIFGGYLVGVGMLDLSSVEYLEQTRSAIGFGDVVLGLVKGAVFGILVAITGCMYGLRSGRSASAVGDATTRAVVSGILSIIVMTVVFALLTNGLQL